MAKTFLDELSRFGVPYRVVVKELLDAGVLQKLASSDLINPRVWANEPEVRENYDIAMQDFIFIVQRIINGVGNEFKSDN